MSFITIEKEYSKAFDEWAELKKEVTILEAKLNSILYPLRRVNTNGVEFEGYREMIATMKEDLYTTEKLLTKKQKIFRRSYV